MAFSDIWVSYLQIYCEVISDLLVPSNSQLSIRERGGNVYVEGLSRSQVSSLADLNRIMDTGDANRVTAATTMNAVSSRSHAALIVTLSPSTATSANTAVPGSTGVDSQLRERSLVIVDLSGSER